MLLYEVGSLLIILFNLICLEFILVFCCRIWVTCNSQPFYFNRFLHLDCNEIGYLNYTLFEYVFSMVSLLYFVSILIVTLLETLNTKYVVKFFNKRMHISIVICNGFLLIHSCLKGKLMKSFPIDFTGNLWNGIWVITIYVSPCTKEIPRFSPLYNCSFHECQCCILWELYKCWWTYDLVEKLRG